MLFKLNVIVNINSDCDSHILALGCLDPSPAQWMIMTPPRSMLRWALCINVVIAAMGITFRFSCPCKELFVAGFFV
jgi:hypothetical protein